MKNSTAIDANKIANTLVLVGIQVKGAMSGKLDKERTNDVNVGAGATTTAARVIKAQLDVKKWINPIILKGNRARDLVNKNGVPFGDMKGSVLMTTERLEAIIPELNKIKGEFYDMVDDMLSHYQDIYQEALRTHGKLFDPASFPSYGSLMKRFKFNVSVSTVPTPSIAGITFGDAAAVEQMVGNIEENTRSIYEDAIKGAVEQLQEDIEHLITSLEGVGVKGRRFHQSSFEKVEGGANVLSGFVQLIEDQDVRNALKSTIDDTLHLATNFDASKVKASHKAKEDATKQAENIAKRVSNLGF